MVIGSIVKIKKCRQYKNKYQYQIGEVKRTYKEMLGVALENHTNPSSSYGLFWFRTAQVEVIADDMTESEDKFMIDGYKVAGVSFLNGTNESTVYVYALYDDNITVNDTVVVKTGHHGFAVAKVVTLDDTKLGKVRYDREIVCKVDMTTYEERKKKEERAAKLKQAMDAKVKELQSQAIYEMLSEKDPTLKAMLDEYKTLLN